MMSNHKNKIYLNTLSNLFMRSYRYQFIISEVFGSENEKLINYLFDKSIDNTQEDI